MNEETVSWIFEVGIKENQLEVFRALMDEMVESTKKNEPGTLNYEWFISEDQKSCHIYERYSDSEATMTHLKTFGERYANRFMTSADPVRFVVYGNPNEQVKAALAGMGVIFMDPLGGFAR